MVRLVFTAETQERRDNTEKKFQIREQEARNDEGP